MAQEMPDLYKQLEELRTKLESHYREVQDFEFTIEKGTLYCLQTRNGKMNAIAMVRTSVEMVDEGLLTREEALLRINPEFLEQLLFPRLDPNFPAKALAKGLPASPGAASGKCIFDADTAEIKGRKGDRVILVREETKPEDIHGFFASQGILTSRGGKTSHAAVVARGMGKPCVAGAEGIQVDTVYRIATVGEMVISEGDVITIDGGTGNVYLGEIPTVDPEWTKELDILLSWADDNSRLGVRANADTPEDATLARKYGATGIGLCRTERMFNAADRLPIVVDMIIAQTLEDRAIFLDRLLPIQKSDFVGIFKAMSPYPVTIRLLDPPIHEFLPFEHVVIDEIRDLKELHKEILDRERLMDSLKIADPEKHAEIVKKRESSGPCLFDVDLEAVEAAIEKKERTLARLRALREINPMLGHRGVRLGVTNREIYEMQIRAILEAAAECAKEGVETRPEIMIPQVVAKSELEWVKNYVDDMRQEVESDYNVKLDFAFGTMIEAVRACVTADRIAEIAEFFSFGTNDLTQAAFSFSREDAENKFLPFYQENGLLPANPFEALDVEGVGQLLNMGVKLGRNTRPDLKVGICGEHGGHPASIMFCDQVGLDYVSCSGPRVPIARLAAAHGKLTASKEGSNLADWSKTL
jgi:pyruvate,orthophosphate dikinase